MILIGWLSEEVPTEEKTSTDLAVIEESHEIVPPSISARAQCYRKAEPTRFRVGMLRWENYLVTIGGEHFLQ